MTKEEFQQMLDGLNFTFLENDTSQDLAKNIAGLIRSVPEELTGMNEATIIYSGVNEIVGVVDSEKENSSTEYIRLSSGRIIESTTTCIGGDFDIKPLPSSLELDNEK